MKKIYVCQASGTEIGKLIKIIFLFVAISFAVFFMLVNLDIIDISNEYIDEEQFNNTIMLIISIAGIYHSSYRLIPPRLQIDSLNNLLIYLGKRIHYSTKLENIHYFFIAEDGIILHSDKKIKIPFSEFENVDLISFANSMNKIIKTNVNFYTILNEGNKIQGFNYLEGESIKQLKEQGDILTNLWWWSNFFIISITSMIIIFSIIKLSSWLFN